MDVVLLRHPIKSGKEMNIFDGLGSEFGGGEYCRGIAAEAGLSPDLEEYKNSDAEGDAEGRFFAQLRFWVEHGDCSQDQADQVFFEWRQQRLQTLGGTALSIG
jgi:hypothetical protein